MANPTVHIDGDKRRIYEVPDLSSFTVDANGYRVYAPTVLTGRENEFVQLQFQEDIWSRFQDWHKANEWSTIALGRSGGASRGLVDGVEGFATNDYEVLTLSGWAFVPADYPHTLEIFGNMLSDQQGVSVFDAVRLQSAGVLAYVRMADSFQVVKISSGSVLTPEQDALLTSIYNEVIYIERWIHVDIEQAIDGNGTQKSPFNNLDSTLTYMESNNLLRLHTVSDLTLDRTSKNFVVVGIGNPTIDFNGQNINGSHFQNCTLRGESTGAVTIDNCDLFNDVQVFGRVRRSAFLGTVEQMGSTNYNGCYSGVTGLGYPKLKITAGDAGVRGFIGSLGADGVTSGNHSIGIGSDGRFIAEPTCSGGAIHVRGFPFQIIDNSQVGCAVTDETESEKVSNLPSAIDNKNELLSTESFP